MPPINYNSLGPDRQLNEIVFAGTHDAGINVGAASARTQTLDIRGQAAAGVRIFDLRIAAAGVAGSGPKKVELRAYHGITTKAEKQRQIVGGGGTTTTETVVRTKMKGGNFGMGLLDMLQDARSFVENEGQTEFLLLKFDKCTNWPLIAEACASVLGGTQGGNGVLHVGGGNLNTTKLRDLQGKVIPLFSSTGLNAAPGFDQTNGFYKFKNLQGSSGGGYSPAFYGLQYYGKGGTGKVRAHNIVGGNVATQSKLMREAKSLQSPDVVGMMYWTYTGTVGSIEKRDTKVWSASNTDKMKSLWIGGLEQYWESSIPFTAPLGQLAGTLRKRFMPNIVMIDFATPDRCKTIFALNQMAPKALADVGVF